MLKFVDLFSGMGGLRLGLEQACLENKIKSKCVMTSEIKNYALSVYNYNFNESVQSIDITSIQPQNIPDHDILLAGFPCQAFSIAGKQLGFYDTRGTLFFNVANILKNKKPKSFILENVEGLMSHDQGNTLKVIIKTLKDIGYHVNYEILNASNFGVPQERKRVFIVGNLTKENIVLKNKECSKIKLKDILESGLPEIKSEFTNKLMSLFKAEDLIGKIINDKRGGGNNIHSWDVELKGSISNKEKELLSRILLERRKKHWAINKNIEWADGMPLTLTDIYSFSSDLFSKEELNIKLNELTNKKYINYEKPKKKLNGKRVIDENQDFGYNIVTGRLSFEINRILDPQKTIGTLVATDLDRLGVIDEINNNKYIRKLSQRELLRISGFPENYLIPNTISHKQFCDLIGNTVCIPVVKYVAKQVLEKLILK